MAPRVTAAKAASDAGKNVSVRFYPNALGKGFIALGISFVASTVAYVKFAEAFKEAQKGQ